ncbi:MAG: bi-domain-containing oxidoreductase [Planctomycetota bacterium]
MKQILQNLGNGETLLADVPCPRRPAGCALIESSRSLVSLGTEKMLVDFGRGGYLAKARSQPDKVKQVLQKIRTDGLSTTLDAVRAKLDTPIPLGYSNVGRVIEADHDSTLTPGMRVISNGPHAEVVAVGEKLVASIPEEVSDETASYTVVASIGLQGVRLIQPTLGESIVVSGLGLIGLLTVQILRANGCRVLGIDFDQRKLELAKAFGAETVDLSASEDPIRAADAWSNGQGVDGVVITASTKSDQLIHQAATMCRKRGRIVLVGVIGLNLQRADFYEKELSFQVSCSYGPGRYDPNYEKLGLDYPVGFVRWTEQRNFQAVLELMREGKIFTDQLTTHRYSFDGAISAYQAISEPGAMGIVLEYESESRHSNQADEGENTEKCGRSIDVSSTSLREPTKSDVGVSFIGAGGFTTRMLLPLLPDKDVRRRQIISSTGVSASHAAQKFRFATCGTDVSDVLNDSSTDAVFVTTPHNTHADLVCRLLEKGKHVFVEKPLAMDHDEIKRILAAQESSSRCVMVGFNRRFSPHSEAIDRWLGGDGSHRAIVITINAGEIPADHWTQDRKIGGGRIIGEGCHFIDLATFLARSTIESVVATAMGGHDGRLGDSVAMQLRFANGSIASIQYLSNGHKGFPKERVEVFSGGRIGVIDNFRKSFVHGTKNKLKTRGQDKGHRGEIEAFLAAIRTGAAAIELEELVGVSRATLDADEQVQQQLTRGLVDQS